MELELYVTDAGVEVFRDWFARLRDKKAKAGIRQRLDRIRDGHFGQVRALREGVRELKIDVGADYRVYYARSGQAVILLLCGGDKKSQAADIDRAISYWRNYRNRIRRL